jgi:hypothetical protein
MLASNLVIWSRLSATIGNLAAPGNHRHPKPHRLGTFQLARHGRGHPACAVASPVRKNYRLTGVFPVAFELFSVTYAQQKTIAFLPYSN